MSQPARLIRPSFADASPCNDVQLRQSRALTAATEIQLHKLSSTSTILMWSEAMSAW
jgi:hypothetical protein